MNKIEFENDIEVIGKWEYYNKFSSKEKIDLSIPKSKSTEKYDAIYFLPNGEKYWIFEGWTKNKLYIHHGGDEPILTYSYELVNFENNKYMYLKGEEDEVVVLKKANNKEYTKYEIGRHDNINYEFIKDDDVIGSWKSFSFVTKIDDFDGNKSKLNNLFVNSIVFYSDGTATMNYYGDESWNDNWTKGYLIDSEKVTAAKYIIKTINNKEYLFLEWKMGNYVYGNQEPEYYVFKRDN